MVHAIGDRAIAELLDIYAERRARHNGERDRRFRIEHAQHIRPSDIPRFAAQDIIASMQPYHAIDDGRWADRVIGQERAKTTYAFRSLSTPARTWRSAATGSWRRRCRWRASTPPSPAARSMTRTRTAGCRSRRSRVEEALKAYTAEGAYASFEESEKGMLAPGMLADMVLVDRDLTAVPPETIRDAKVLLTIVGGRVVYEAGDRPGALAELASLQGPSD